MQRSTRKWAIAFCSTIIVLTGMSDRAAAQLFPNLPEDFSVYAVGTYRGETDVDDVVLDDSGNAVKQVDVVVNKPGESVVLVLSAYDPVVWRVGHTEATAIAGVIVGGYHGQAVIGLDQQVPTAVSTHHEKGEFEPFWAYKATPALLSMNATVNDLVGKELSHFCVKTTDGVFLVGQLPAAPKSDVVYADNLSAKEALAKLAPVDTAMPTQPKPSTLEDLVSEGKIRAATTADIEAWVDKASEKYRRFNPDLRVPVRMRVDRTYVVEKSITLPNGLFGAHSRSFIIEKGVPFPEGPKCHNSFYLIDGTEQGPHVRPKNSPAQVKPKLPQQPRA